jgi:hypothetical protein
MNWGMLLTLVVLITLMVMMITMLVVLNLDEKPGGFFHAWSRRKRRPNRKR